MKLAVLCPSIRENEAFDALWARLTEGRSRCRVSGTPAAKARNALVAWALHSDATHWLWVDDDLDGDPDVLVAWAERLAAAPLGEHWMAGAAYVRRGERSLVAGERCGQTEGTLHPVTWVGAHCCLSPAATMRRLAGPQGQLPAITYPSGLCWPVWRYGVARQPGTELWTETTEEIIPCYRIWNELGGRCYLDTGFSVGHREDAASVAWPTDADLAAFRGEP